MVTSDQLRSALAFWLPYMAIASICLAAGLTALVLSLLRSRDRLLLWIGVMATLYALRLFWENDLVRISLGALPLRTPIAIVTYIIPIPYLLFFRELMGVGWKSSIRIWFWVQVIFAPLAILGELIVHASDTLSLVNNVLVVGGTALVLVPVLIRRGTSVPSPVRYSVFAFLLLALATNLHLQSGGRNLEPFGFLVLIGGLGYTAARRAIGREQTLVAVESELATARRIQMSILPRVLPRLAGLEVAASYRPMAAVAGDFYDFLRLDEHRVTVLVADVSGHGVPAALIASMLKVAFAQQAPQAADPAAILTGLNGVLHGVLEGQFVTAACAHIDLTARMIVYAGAGHPPAILSPRRGGDLLELAENGLFLGPFRNASYANVRAPFEAGDRLVLYTDGIVEATFSDGEPFGPERLREFTAALRNSDPEAFVEGLINKVSIGPQEDDLTVVVLQAAHGARAG